MKLIDPIDITPALFVSGLTLSEDPTPAWAAGSTYTVGTEVHLPSTHRVYKDAAGGVSNTSPDLDPERWKDMRITNRMAPFDLYASTVASSTTQDIVYPIKARFARALALYGLAGSTWEVTVHEEEGGPLLKTYRGRIRAPSSSWYDYLYGDYRSVRSVHITNLPIRPSAVITVRVRAQGAGRRAIGLIAMGRFRPLIGRAPWGGVEYGATAEPVSYTYSSTDSEGNVVNVPGPSATNLRCRIMLPRIYADNALALMQDVLGRPVAWLVDQPGYRGLAAFGVATAAPVSYAGNGHSFIELNIKGYK